MKILNIAVIGVGWIGGIHCECYRRIEPLLDDIKIVLHTVADVIDASAQNAKRKYGFINSTTNWREVIENTEIDIVDICVDNVFHKEIVLAAAKAGKHIACEKPLAANAHDAEIMVNIANQFNVKNMINFNYRKVPALAYIKTLIVSGKIGNIYHIKGMFEQDFGFDSPMSWRFNKAKSGGGSIITMGSHLIDLARFLCGEYKSVVATGNTYINERINSNTGKMETCDVDDALTFIAKFKNGAIGMFLTSWVSHGRKHHCEIEIFGSEGSVSFNSERLNEIELFVKSDNKLNDGIRTVMIGEGHPSGNLFALKTGMGIGIKESFVIQLYDFINAISDDKEMTPNFADALEMEKVSEAIIQSSIQNKWVNLETQLIDDQL